MNKIKKESDSLKVLIKEAITEVLAEHREFIQEAVTEAIEDMALSRAIEEGKTTKRVSRSAIFKILSEK